VVGLVGGIGSGKSRVAQELERLGAVILDGDRTGHVVLEDPQVVRELTSRWGEGILQADGRVDRKRVAERVFAPPPWGPENLRYLEKVAHPRIGSLLHEQLDRLRRQSAGVVVLDAAVLLEAGWDRWCDRIVFVDAPRDVRLARCRQRGWSDEQFAAREAVQMELDRKRSLADHVIDNASDVGSMRRQVERYWHDELDRPSDRPLR
jgi:dephospho-CoA kinase